MRYALLLPLVFSPLLLLGQPGGDGGGYAVLTDHLMALYSSWTDEAQDEANAKVKEELRGILSSDSALTASFADIPITHVGASDGSFRLFTWALPRMDGSVLHEGLLLVAKRNKHALYELRDMTSHITRPTSAQLTPENWYGAVYYEAIPVKRGAKTYYTLLGSKGFSNVESRKVIDVLDLSGSMPRFGAPLFPGERQRKQREVYSFSAQASMLLRWEPTRKAIVLDHLSPIRSELAGQPAFMAPDLSYDSFTWAKDHWHYERDIDARGSERGRPYNAPPPEGR